MRPHRDDPEADRLLDAMLGEALRGVQPPDLTARIARELEVAPVRAPEAPQVRPRPRTGRVLLYSVAAGVAFATTFLWYPSQQGGEAEVVVTLLRGTARYAGSTTASLSAGVPRAIELRRGDRFDAGAAGAGLFLHPLGRVDLERLTSVQVNAMEWNRRDGVLVLGSVTLGVVTGAVSAGMFGDKRTAVAGGEVRIEAPGAAAPEVGSAGGLREQIAQLTKENADLRAALQRQPVESQAPVVPASPLAGGPSVAVRGPAFDDPDLGAALAKIDWSVMGANMREMIPLLDALAQADDISDIPPDVFAKLTRLNADLVQQAAHAIAGKLPGTGVNGAFTHPIMAANQISSALESAGLGLDERQRELLQRTMRFYSEKDRSLRIADDNRELKLETLIEEIEYKEQFYEEARRLMTPEQQAVLYSDGTKGRVRFDLFGTGLMLGEFVAPIQARDNAEFATRFSGALSARIDLDPGTRKQVDAIIQEWATTLPADIWSNGPRNANQFTSAMVRDMAVRQRELMRRILGEVRLTPASRALLAKSMKVFVPLSAARKQ